MSEKKEIEMKVEKINEGNIHHQADESELNRLETNLDESDIEVSESKTSSTTQNKKPMWIAVVR